MSDFIVVGMIFGAVGIGIVAVGIITNWDDVCDGWENRHDNIRRLAAWHKRRALRRWYKLLTVIERVKARCRK